jgi:hypothetical protein
MSSTDPTPPLDLDALEDLAADSDPLLVLTDEELAVVTAETTADDRLVPLEVLDDLDADQWSLVARTAFRSLVARGLAAGVEGGEVDRERGLVELEVYPPLLTVLDVLARSWPTVLAAREVDGTLCRRVLLTVGDRVVLEHEAHAGFHRFCLFPAEEAVVQLAAFLDPDGAAGDQDVEVLRGPADAPPAGWSRLRAQLDVPGASASLVALRDPRHTPATLVMEVGASDEGLLLVTGEHADDAGEATEVAVRRLARGSVLGLATHALGLHEALAGEGA